jgi:hypothetical protein
VDIKLCLNYAKKTNTDVPNLDGLLYLLGRINRAMKLMYPEDESSDESLQPSESDGDLTKPHQWYCRVPGRSNLVLQDGRGVLRHG